MARKQSATIYFEGLKHKEIYFRGYYNDAMYKEKNLVWRKLNDEILFQPLNFMSNRDTICSFGYTGRIVSGKFQKDSLCVCKYEKGLDCWRKLFYYNYYITGTQMENSFLTDEGIIIPDGNYGEYSALCSLKGVLTSFSETTNFLFKGKGEFLGNLGKVYLYGASAYTDPSVHGMTSTSCRFVMTRIGYDYYGNPQIKTIGSKVFELGYDITEKYGNVTSQCFCEGSEEESNNCYLGLFKLKYETTHDEETSRTTTKSIAKFTIISINVLNTELTSEIKVVSSKEITNSITTSYYEGGKYVTETIYPAGSPTATEATGTNLFNDDGYKNIHVSLSCLNSETKDRYDKNRTIYMYNSKFELIYSAPSSVFTPEQYFKFQAIIKSNSYITIASNATSGEPTDVKYIRFSLDSDFIKLTNVPYMFTDILGKSNWKEAFITNGTEVRFGCYDIGDNGAFSIYDENNPYKGVIT